MNFMKWLKKKKKEIEVIKPIIEGQETHSLINLMRPNKKVGHLLIIWIELRVWSGKEAKTKLKMIWYDIFTCGFGFGQSEIIAKILIFIPNSFKLGIPYFDVQNVDYDDSPLSECDQNPNLSS